MSRKVVRSEQEWRRILGDARYRVARAGGTEPPFTGAYWDCHDDGVYRCACCGEALFDARHKFDSGSGWPSFTRVVEEGAVETRRDTSHGMVRTEVLCRACGAHLGHVFPDGPAPGGLRYCINSICLELDRDAARRRDE